MSSKDDILNNIRKNKFTSFEKPDLSIKAVEYPDSLSKFISMIDIVGGKAIMLPKDADVNQVISDLYPEAKVIASNLECITIATINPDNISTPLDLNRTEVAVVKGEIGVAENGCVWIPQNVKEKAVYFITEYLVILLSRSSIVDNMHEAYKAITFSDYGFGTFISGPSKTADIEQALVMGAQSARGVTILITDD